jgi:nucleotide-binding universal stress UspA family protein
VINNVVTVDKQNEDTPDYEKAKPDTPDYEKAKPDTPDYEKTKPDTPDYEKANVEATKESEVPYEMLSISKEGLPSLSKIVITDDGKHESNKAFNYAVALSRQSNAELVILRILEDFEKVEGVSVEGVGQDNVSNSDMKREVKGEIIDEMESKIKRCREAGCENKISYKFKVGRAIEEIVKEIKEGNYDLLVLRSSHLDTWVNSLFSDARKIISNIEIPVLIVQ